MRPDDVVRLLLEARGAGDVTRVMTLLAPDVELQPAPGSPVLRGSHAVRTHLHGELATGVRVEIEPHRVEMEGDRVHVVGRRRVFERGALSDSPAAWTFTVRAGRVVRMEPLAATAGLRRVA
jgi:ketosteroid isomerase-like protein